MKNHLFLLATVFLIVSCNNLPPKEKELREILNKSLNLENFETVQQANTHSSFEKLKQTPRYFSVVYLQNSCRPCYPKFIQWQQKMDSIDTPDNYTVLFVIKGDSYGEFMANVLDIEYVEDKYYTIMDPEGKFLANNSDIPNWMVDASLLIDSGNKIKMVGAPFDRPEMTELFYEICQ